jgi:hypothetical protein
VDFVIIILLGHEGFVNCKVGIDLQNTLQGTSSFFFKLFFGYLGRVIEKAFGNAVQSMFLKIFNFFLLKFNMICTF